MTVSRHEVLEILREARKELDTFHRMSYREDYWVRWHNKLRATLRKVFGDDSTELKGYHSVSSWGRPVASIGLTQEQQDERDEDKFDYILVGIRGWLDALLFQVEKFGLDANPEPQIEKIAPNVFVAHGGDSTALTHLVDFVDALGCNPIIAEKMPSQDRSVDENVEFWMDQSHCAIVLATGDELAGDQVVARPNVHIEIGRFQERFPGRIVYLLEKGASLPSNVSEKVYERFTQDNLTKAFMKVAKELSAFGLLEAGA